MEIVIVIEIVGAAERLVAAVEVFDVGRTIRSGLVPLLHNAPTVRMRGAHASVLLLASTILRPERATSNDRCASSTGATPSTIGDGGSLSERTGGALVLDFGLFSAGDENQRMREVLVRDPVRAGRKQFAIETLADASEHVGQFVFAAEQVANDLHVVRDHGWRRLRALSGEQTLRRPQLPSLSGSRWRFTRPSRLVHMDPVSGSGQLVKKKFVYTSPAGPWPDRFGWLGSRPLRAEKSGPNGSSAFS